MLPLLSACVGTVVMHFACTAKAAPNILSLRSAPDDEGAADRGNPRRDLREMALVSWALFQFITFVVMVWALVEVCEAA